MASFNDLNEHLCMHVHECGAVGGQYSGNGNSNNYNNESYRKTVGEVDKLGNVNYTLRSDDNRIIKVPVRYAKKASKIVNFALESKEFSELKAKIRSNEELAKMYIPERIEGIVGRGKKIGSNGSRKLIDEIYFTSCLNQCYDDLIAAEGNERLESIKHIEFFKGILKNL